MTWKSNALILGSLLALVALATQCTPSGPPGGGKDNWSANSGSRETRKVAASGSGGGGVTSIAAMMRQINWKQDMVGKGTYGRKVVRPMRPRYITIHSTQNYTADASRHSLALKRGALRARKRPGGNRIGFLIWHFTVDDRTAIQHMPTSEQGEHADFSGPGNRLSIGIEMCEQRGSNIPATIDRTAKLTAILMKRNGIPIQNVVPHYHWPRSGAKPPNKNCPHFLMENGRPGKKWKAFQNKVEAYYRRLG